MRDAKGRFVKGAPSENPEGLLKGRGWNKGMKGWTNAGSFKKGHEVNEELRKAVGKRSAGNTYRRGIQHTAEAKEKNRIAHLGKVTMAGESHYNWKGGITPHRKKHYFTKEYRNWRKEVFERDNYTCRNCNTEGGEINAHHLHYYSAFPELRTSVNNGVTLCRSCHVKVHKLNRRDDSLFAEIMRLPENFAFLMREYA